jgi:phenylalanyl-tRNA synthetase alpha chain
MIPPSMNDLDSLVQQAQAEFDAAPTAPSWKTPRRASWARAGRVTELLKGLASAAAEEKKTRGAEINQPSSRSRPR